MRIKVSLLMSLALLIVLQSMRAYDTNSLSPAKIGAAMAAQHYNENLVVTGLVAQVNFRSRLVFLNFDKPYPDSPFAGVIFSPFTNQFTNLPSLEGRIVEVTGMITNYRNKPEIVLTNAIQLTVLASPAAVSISQTNGPAPGGTGK
jgi:hypothetical protein